MRPITEPTERDRAIIRAVHTFRLLRSRDHILPLFGGRMRALVRARRLAHSGYLQRLPGRAPHEQEIFAVGNRGADLLARCYGLSRPKTNYAQQNRRLKTPHIAHTLLIASVMIGIETACRHGQARFISQEEILRQAPRRDPMRIEAFVKWQGLARGASIYPDWVFGIEAGERPQYFFLEADRGTMPVSAARLDKSSILKKMLVYQAASRVRWGGPNAFEEAFGIRGIRTLFIAAPGASYGGAGTKRLESFIEANRGITKEQGSGQFLFAGPSFLKAEDPLSAPLLSGHGETVSLVSG